MSVSSILAFVLAGAAAFKGPRDRAEESPKRKAYKALKAELSEARTEAHDLRLKVNELESDIAELNRNARRDQDLIDHWRARADWRPSQIALQQAALPAQAQLAQYQGLQNSLAGAQLLGAQNLNAELWCNCVPSRSQVWATTDPE